MDKSSASAMRTVSAFFESGKRGDFTAMRAMLVDGPEFSCFGDVPPFGMHDAQTAVILEEMRLAAISDYNYTISDERVLVTADSAVAAFTLRQTGMLVDNKTFSGKIVSIESRATFALVWQDAWKIVHMHVSQIEQRSGKKPPSAQSRA